MNNIECGKAAKAEKLSAKFFKNGEDILAKSIPVVFNLSIFRGVFPDLWNVGKEKSVFKKGRKLTFPTAGQFHYS